MKRLTYFIWEKSNLNNKGISLKFSTSRYCYIKPTMSNTWDNVFKKPWFDKPYHSFYVCSEKVFYWLWFRLTLKVEYEFLSIVGEPPKPLPQEYSPSLNKVIKKSNESKDKL